METAGVGAIDALTTQRSRVQSSCCFFLTMSVAEGRYANGSAEGVRLGPPLDHDHERRGLAGTTLLSAAGGPSYRGAVKSTTVPTPAYT